MKKIIIIAGLAIGIMATASAQNQPVKEDTVHLALPVSKYMALVEQLNFYYRVSLTSQAPSYDVQKNRAGTQSLLPFMAPMEADTSKKVIVTIVPKKPKS